MDACTVFAAALYDVLSLHGIPCKMVTAEKIGLNSWGIPWLKPMDGSTIPWGRAWGSEKEKPAKLVAVRVCQVLAETESVGIELHDVSRSIKNRLKPK